MKGVFTTLFAALNTKHWKPSKKNTLNSKTQSRVSVKYILELLWTQNYLQNSNIEKLEAKSRDSKSVSIQETSEGL